MRTEASLGSDRCETPADVGLDYKAVIAALEPILRRGGENIHASPRADGSYEARAGDLILVTHFKVRTALAIPVRVESDSPGCNGLSTPDRIRAYIEIHDPHAVRWSTGDLPYRFAANRRWRCKGRRAWRHHTAKECT